jgi:hypothetical protein
MPSSRLYDETQGKKKRDRLFFEVDVGAVSEYNSKYGPTAYAYRLQKSTDAIKYALVSAASNQHLDTNIDSVDVILHVANGALDAHIGHVNITYQEDPIPLRQNILNDILDWVRAHNLTVVKNTEGYLLST